MSSEVVSVISLGVELLSFVDLHLEQPGPLTRLGRPFAGLLGEWGRRALLGFEAGDESIELCLGDASADLARNPRRAFVVAVTVVRLGCGAGVVLRLRRDRRKLRC
jgi:hypothetical protein